MRRYLELTPSVLNMSTAEIPSTSRSVVIDPLEICRICLDDKSPILIDVLGSDDPSLFQHVYEYYKVEMKGNDGRSTKLCGHCMENIDVWRGQVHRAIGCQMVVNYLAEKKHVLPIPSAMPIDEVQFTNDNNQAASISNDEIESASTSNNIIQSTSFSIHQPSMSNFNTIQESKVNSSIQLELPRNVQRVHRYVTRSSTSKIKKNICPFCITKQEIVYYSSLENIIFCVKHSKPFSCLIPNCHSVFSNKALFILHYRSHLHLDKMTYLCNKCFGVLGCSKKTGKKRHLHQNLTALLNCCSRNFVDMNGFVLHKLHFHSSASVGTNFLLQFKTIMARKSLKIEEISEVEEDKTTTEAPNQGKNKHLCGQYKCKHCSHYFSSVSDYVDHSKNKHNNIIAVKEPDIKLCPLCEINYHFNIFVEHMEHCANTMRIGNVDLNQFGCIYCSTIFIGITAYKFRTHLLYCKTFQVVSENDIVYKKCIFCTFKSIDDSECLLHANNYCIEFQLRQRYASSADEQNQVVNRMDYDANAKPPLANPNSSTPKFCDKTKRRLLFNNYNFLCKICQTFFYDKRVFLFHLTEYGTACRPASVVYCQDCLTDFEFEDDYKRHLGNADKPGTSSSLVIKQEIPDSINYSDSDNNYVANNNDMKEFVMSDPSFFPLLEVSNTDVINSYAYEQMEHENSNTQFQELEPSNIVNSNMELETEVSNPDLNNSYAYNVLDGNIDHNNMQFVVEEKPKFDSLIEDTQ